MTEVFRLCDDYITRWAALDPVAAGVVGLTRARRQAVAAAAAADQYAGTHDALVASYGDGPLAGELAAAVEQAHGAYQEMARYLREDYAPRAAERDDDLAEALAQVLFRPMVDDAAHLAQRTLDGLRGQDARHHRDADGVLDPRGELGAGAGRVRFGAAAPALDVPGE